MINELKTLRRKLILLLEQALIDKPRFDFFGHVLFCKSRQPNWGTSISASLKDCVL